MRRRGLLVGLAATSIGSLIAGCSDDTPLSHRDPLPADPGGMPGGKAGSSRFPSPPVAGLDGASAAARQAAAASSPFPPPVEPLVVEKVLYNLGLQSNLANRIRQDINLFALLAPALRLFAAGEKLDRSYLASGITNKRLFGSLYSRLLPFATTADFNDANDVVKIPGVRTFLVDYWTSLYDHKAFVEFTSKQWDGSDWRRTALLQLNTLWYFDSMQAAILRPIVPVLMSRMRLPADSSSKALIEGTAASLAFFRTAWATSTFSDDDVYQLVTVSSSPALNKVLRLIVGATAVVCDDLGRSMDAALPPDLTGLLKKPLDSLQKEAS